MRQPVSRSHATRDLKNNDTSRPQVLLKAFPSINVFDLKCCSSIELTNRYFIYLHQSGNRDMRFYFLFNTVVTGTSFFSTSV